MATMTEIGRKIRAARVDAGLSQSELSQMFDGKITSSRISHLENATHCVIRSDEAELYSKLFGLPVGDLTITGERPRGWAMRGEYDISDLCKRYMKAKCGTKLSTIADALDISKYRIRAIINGGSLARKDEAIKLARYFENQGATEKEFLSMTKGDKKAKKEDKVMSNVTVKNDIPEEGNWRDKAFMLQKEVNDLRARLAEATDNSKSDTQIDFKTEMDDLKKEVEMHKNERDEEHDRAERYKIAYHDTKDKLESVVSQNDTLTKEYNALKDDMLVLFSFIIRVMKEKL